MNDTFSSTSAVSFFDDTLNIEFIDSLCQLNNAFSKENGNLVNYWSDSASTHVDTSAGKYMLTPNVRKTSDYTIVYEPTSTKYTTTLAKMKYLTQNYFDMIEKVIYGIKEEDDTTILTTVVYFTDGTRSIVKNSKNDHIGIIKHDDGTITPDNDTKLTGLLYAVAKRFMGVVNNEKNVVEPNGYMRKLQRIVDASLDSNQLAVRKAAEKREAKARHLKMIEDHRRQKAESKKTASRCKCAKHDKTYEVTDSLVKTIYNIITDITGHDTPCESENE